MKQIASFAAIVAVVLVVGFTHTLSAQETEVVEIKKGEVVRVIGNNLIVRVEGEGVKRYVVPSDFKFNHEGQEISVRELREGMQLTGVRLRTTGGEVIAEEDIDKVMAEVAEAPVEAAEAVAQTAEAAAQSEEDDESDEDAEESIEAPAAAAAAAAESAETAEAAAAESGGMSPALMIGLLLLALVLVVFAVKQLRKA